MRKQYDDKRPNIPADIRRIIEVDAGHKCTIKNCSEHTYLEIHHINLNREDNRVDNLILLCNKHHKMAHANKIDRKSLKEYKKLLNTQIQDYETMINNKINNSDSFYKNLLNEFENRIRKIKFNWLETLPEVDWSLKTNDYNELSSLVKWINSRYSIENDDLVSSFKNLSISIENTLKIFELHITQPREDYYFIEKFYKQVEYYANPELRKQLESEFDNHIYKLIDSTIEVAKNFNTVFKIIRRDIDSNFLSDIGIIPTLHGQAIN